MSVINISEEEATNNFGPVLKKLTVGDTVVIDSAAGHIELLATRGRGRTVAEALEILKALPGERGVMDDEFAADVRFAMERTRALPDRPSPWD
ncbi:MAG: hypothetical protein M3R43_07195 [Acidobacteriota bacterium]|nr:hypothetical protein [Acidobacteriota bacterium]